MSALKIEYLPYYTYEDYKHWEGRWELIYGIAYAMSPMPMIKHQNITGKIFGKCMLIITVVIPAYKVKKHIETVVQTLPEFNNE